MARPKITDEDMAAAQLLIDTFRPRMDVYASRLDTPADVERMNAWVAKQARGGRVSLFRLGDWKPVRRNGAFVPLTAEVVARHVAGLEVLGLYPLHPDGTCNSVGVDFDNHRGARIVERDPREDFDALVNVCLRRGVRFLGQHSRGGRGYWVHLLLPTKTRAAEARRVLQALLDEAEVKHISDGGTYDDLFPKQDRPYGEKNPGNLFCLPCSRARIAADPPGTHFVGTALTLAAQIEHLREL